MASGEARAGFYGLSRFPRFLLMAANFFVLARHMLFSAWVIFGGRQEIATGDSYQWPLVASVLSVASFLVSLALAFALLGVLMNRWCLERVVVACLAFFVLYEGYESIMLHVLYGPMKITDFSAYLYGPLVAILAVINWRLLLRKRL